MLKKLLIAYLFLFGIALLINSVLMHKEAQKNKNRTFEEVKSVVVEKKAVPVYSKKAGGWYDEIHTKFCYQRGKDTICLSTTATVNEKIGDTIALVVSLDDLTKYDRAEHLAFYRIMPLISFLIGTATLIATIGIVFNKKIKQFLKK
jgi:hypothetical protein